MANAKRSTLRPAVIFDLDDTLVQLVDGWGDGSLPTSEALINSKAFMSTAFLYHCIDYMINDKPDWVDDGKIPENWPQEIFFLTARPESVREDTVYNLARITRDSGTSISKRLIMRPDMPDCARWGQHECKTFLIKKLRDRGFYPVMAFDNDPAAIQAYIDAGVDGAFLSMLCARDKEDYSTGNLI